MYEYCFFVETFNGISSKVIKVDGTGQTELQVNGGLLNLVTSLNTLGSEGWNCIGYDSNYRNNLNFWTL
jgi:hypothetical protein